MESRPLVSIITIVYNGEQHIADTIRSVGRQTYRNIEYIIVDGGSTDNTLSIVDQFKDSVTAVISEKDRGISDAFNKGIRRSGGEIIGIINADDWYESDTVERIVEKIRGFDVAYGDLRLWKEDAPDFIVKGDHGHLRHEMTINHPTVFVRRECYDRFGLFDEEYKCAMDYDLLLRLLNAGCRFVYVSGVLANMRWGGMSDAQWKLGCRETLQIKNKYMPQRRNANRLYYYKHVLAIRVPRLLRRFSLNFIIRLYRSRFAKIPKVYK
jgi:glycosyltransferase involved in cell wall biosynthesis